MKHIYLTLLCCVLLAALPACDMREKNGSNGADSLEKILTSADTLKSECKEMFTIDMPTSAINPAAKLNIAQGGTVDGTYYYQAFIRKHVLSKEADNIVRIVKSELATGEIVQTSDNLKLNHANDITYNPKTNELIVVHNVPNTSRISIIDADTLTLKETKDIGVNIYCLDYNETYDEYVIGLSGGQSFQILNSDFTAKSSVFQPTDRTDGFVTQGCSSCGDYIYFVLYKDNVITVYDRGGNFITLIQLDVKSLEPENITVINDKIYVGCYSATYGAKLFEVTPVLEAE